jgi:peptide/nickel transport system permease protein
VTRYLLRRLAQAVVVLLGATVLAFGVMFVGGDPTALLTGPDWTRDQVLQFRHLMGFDQPWYLQYLHFLAGAVRGNFGTSLQQQQPVLALVLQRLPASAELAGAAMLLALALAIPAGVLSASRRASALDAATMVGALFGQSVPSFWLGLMLLLVFAVDLGWFPVQGQGGLSHLVLPAVTLSTFPLALFTRLTRSSVLEVMALDYIKTARAKGLSQRVVLYKHALRNALIPVVTLIGLNAGALLGGVVVIEQVFGWPGVGLLTLNAVESKDFPLVVGAVTVSASIFVAINLVVDLAYGVLDPRIRYA